MLVKQLDPGLRRDDRSCRYGLIANDLNEIDADVLAVEPALVKRGRLVTTLVQRLVDGEAEAPQMQPA